MPCLKELCLSFVPITRVQKTLDIEEVIVANGYDTGEFSHCSVELVRYNVHGVAQLRFKSLFGGVLDMLQSTCTYDGQQTGVLERQMPIL